MKKEELKVKAKEFWSKNSDIIKVGVIGGVCAGVGSVLTIYGIKTYGRVVITSENLGNIIMDAQKRYGDKLGNLTMYLNVIDNGLKPEELGELGKCMLRLDEANGVSKERNFTHFIAFGPTSK